MITSSSFLSHGIQSHHLYLDFASDHETAFWRDRPLSAEEVQQSVKASQLFGVIGIGGLSLLACDWPLQKSFLDSPVHLAYHWPPFSNVTCSIDSLLRSVPFRVKCNNMTVQLACPPLLLSKGGYESVRNLCNLWRQEKGKYRNSPHARYCDYQN